MKKTYFVILLLLFVFTTEAQYTLTLGSMYVPGDIIEYSAPCSNTLVSPGSSGIGQTWNYLSLNPVWVASNTSTCISMSSVPHSSLFPTGTMGISDLVGYATVYENTSSSSKVIGFAQPSFSNSVGFSNPQTLFTFPFTFGSFFTDTWEYTDLTGTYSGTLNVFGDGTGLLLLPGMSHPNVLKVRTVSTQTLIITASTYTNNSIRDDFYNSSSKSPLLSVFNSTMTSSTNTVTYNNSSAEINKYAYTGIIEHSGNSPFSFYPNPATTYINIKTADNLKIEKLIMLDITGRKVLEQKESTSQINIETLEQGIYQLQIISEGKNYSSKFIKD